MATAISEANFEAALGACADAVEADDLATARKQYALAEIQLAGLLKAAGGGGISVTRQTSLEAVKAALDVLSDTGSAGGGPWELTSRGVI